MKGESLFKDIVSGRVENPLAAAALGGLSLLSKVYERGVTMRNKKYDAGRNVHHASVPVISVGNITAGGTGKTPMVGYLCRELMARGYHPAVLSRGYKAASNKTSLVVAHRGQYRLTPNMSGDEAWLLARGLVGGSVVIGRSRVLSAELAVRDLMSDVLVMDDGFQHRALARDLDIVLIDAANPFGYGRVLPRGLLREPLNGLRRADVIILTKTNQVDEYALQHIYDTLRSMVPNVPVAETIHKPTGISELSAWHNGEAASPVASYTDKKILAVSGIGQPESFTATLREAGYHVVGTKAFGDHHDYTEEDAVRIWGDAFACGADAVAITEKDAVKLAMLPAMKDLHMPVLVLSVGIAFTKNEEAVQQALDKIKGADKK